MQGVYFQETLHRRSFMKMKSSRNGEINMSFTDIGKSCPSCKFLMSQICLLTLLVKIKFSQKKIWIYSTEVKRSPHFEKNHNMDTTLSLASN